jgi:hypothetical protein
MLFSPAYGEKNCSLFCARNTKFARKQGIHAARATIGSFALALAHAEGVNSLICVILAEGKRVNKSFK